MSPSLNGVEHHTVAVLNPPQLVTTKPLVVATNVVKSYDQIRAVNNVDLSVYPGEIMGIVGESGSGKSTLLRMLNLQEMPDGEASGQVASGQVASGSSYSLDIPGYEGVNLFALDRYAQRDVVVKEIGIVYQHPQLGLRMRNTSSGNVAERLLIAGERRFYTMRDAAQESLAASEFPLDRMDDLPIRLSGGMQQRVQLAKAIALKPKLLLLDEPTSGLDVSVQATVLDTLKRLQRETDVTMIIVSHDLGVIRTLADRVMVMRNGDVVEVGLTDQILEDPLQAYTQQLVHAKL